MSEEKQDVLELLETTQKGEVQNESIVEIPNPIPGYIAESILLAMPAPHVPESILLNERCIIMPEAVIFGCLLQELADSFLVALPMVIQVNNDGESQGKLTPRCKVARFFKTQIESITIPTGQQRYFYSKALLEHQETNEEFLTPERIQHLEEWMANFEEEFPDKVLFNIGEELGLTEEEDSVTVSWDMPSNASDKSFQYIWLETTKH
jgi:hypothetical protein